MARTATECKGTPGLTLVVALALAVAFAAWKPGVAAAAVAPSPDNDAAVGKPSVPVPGWTKAVGARRAPSATRAFKVDAPGDGKTLATQAIQKAIDACAAAGGGVVTLGPGAFVSGSLFVKDNVELVIPEGTTLSGSQDDKDYPPMPTRVAGIEMTWPAALINFYAVKNVKISGGGTIDGNGKKWWDAYWALRKIEDPKGLRGFVDYDAARPRLIVAWKCEDVTIENLRLRRSGFWTIQIVYCDHATVNGAVIRDNAGPSTDGVDIDSSSNVLVENCDVNNNDDDICLKAGRDWDGLRVNRPTEYVVIRNNVSRKGDGVIAFGSETAGVIRHVVCYGNLGVGTKVGMRFKSTATRGGGAEDVLICDGILRNVPIPFAFVTNWNPNYSTVKIPAGMTGVPDYWKTLAHPVTPKEKGYPLFRDVRIVNCKAENAKNMILSSDGMAEKPVSDIHWKNVTASGARAGQVAHSKDWTFENVTFRTPDGKPLEIKSSVNVESPTVVADPSLARLKPVVNKRPVDTGDATNSSQEKAYYQKPVEPSK